MKSAHPNTERALHVPFEIIDEKTRSWLHFECFKGQ
jgi:hypothetical protein